MLACVKIFKDFYEGVLLFRELSLLLCLLDIVDIVDNIVDGTVNFLVLLKSRQEDSGLIQFGGN